MIKLFLALSFVVAIICQAPTTSLIANRLSGPAPLAVLFDGTGTTLTGVDTFREVIYSFNFGDPNSGTWAISGVSKNSQLGGPLAAHVYDNPGTYIVTMTATRNGATSQSSLSITVTNPNTHWSSTNTVCVSTSSNFNGCPTGALQQTALPSSYDGKRVLLRRGESFGVISIASSSDNALVGSYGSGNMPIVASVNLGGSGSVADWPDDITIMDLNIGNGFNLETTGSRILLYRNDISTPATIDSQVNIGTAIGYYVEHGTLSASSYYWPREIFIVENDIQGETSGDGTPNLTLMGFFMRSALLGNAIDRATEHTVRIWAANSAILAHNSMGGNHFAPNPPGIRGALKLHSNGLNAYSDNVGTSGLAIRTSKVIIADNNIGSPTYPGSWVSGAAPQNADPGTTEAIEDIIFERNLYIRGPYSSLESANRGRRITARYNTVQGGGIPRMERVGATFDPALDSWDGPYYFEDTGNGFPIPPSAPQPPTQTPLTAPVSVPTPVAVPTSAPMAAPTATSTLLVRDYFTSSLANRVPDSLTVGSNSWSVSLGSLAVSNGALSSSVAHRATINTNRADIILSVQVSFTDAGEPGLLFRYVDPNNWLAFRLKKNGWYIRRYLNAVSTNLATNSTTFSVNTNYSLQVRTKGTSVSLYINGSLVSTLNVSDFVTASHHGVTSATNRAVVYDNFTVYSN